MKMKKILMIGTGGTIASKETENGLTPGLTPEDILYYIPNVKNICDVETIQVCNLDSTDVRPEHWKLMVKSIEQNYYSYDGFVICHGTDTLAYTACALSYMIQNSNKPIVITGAQKPISHDVTDARTNLLDSFIYASDKHSQGVNIVFDGKVIAGTRAKKEMSKSYNAFSSINFPYHAVIRDGRLIRYIPETPYKERVLFYYNMKDSVCVLKLIPGLKPDILYYLFENYDSIVVESFGVGGMPKSLTDVFRAEMKKWEEEGKHVVVTTQVVNEGSDMMVYAVGKTIKKEFNLMEAYDMTTEAVITKLMWLMGMEGLTKKEFRELFYQQINYDILFAEQ